MPESESGALPTWLYPNTFFEKINWAGRARTYEMPESKSGALPLGYSPISKQKAILTFPTRFARALQYIAKGG